MKHEILKTSTGIELKHRNGWMMETNVAKAVGFTQAHQVRSLPIPRISVAHPKAKPQSYNRYRAEDVKAFIEANTTTPGLTA
jgi:hypothetical protein